MGRVSDGYVMILDLARRRIRASFQLCGNDAWASDELQSLVRGPRIAGAASFSIGMDKPSQTEVFEEELFRDSARSRFETNRRSK